MYGGGGGGGNVEKGDTGIGVYTGQGAFVRTPREYISVSAYRNHNIMLKLGGPSFPFLF